MFYGTKENSKGKRRIRPTAGQHRLLGTDPGRGGRQGRANQAADWPDTPARAGSGDDGRPGVREKLELWGQPSWQRAHRKNGATGKPKRDDLYPHDWARTFESIIVPKREKRVSLFNDQIIQMNGDRSLDTRTF